VAADYEEVDRKAPTDPEVVEGDIELPVPVSQLWRLFSDVAGWPSWNSCMAVARVRPAGQLRTGATLLWAFRPLRRRYLYRLPAVATLTVVRPEEEVTWRVRLPGFDALHTYSFTDLGGGRCRFGSWEQASGPLYRLLRPFWLAHFRFVRDASLAGAATAVRRHEGAARLVLHGSADGTRPVLVVPGLDGSVGTVAPLVEALARTRPVYLVDYRTERNPTLELFSAEIAALVRDAGLPPVDVVASSLGCIAAAQAVADHGVACDRLALVGPFTVLDSRRLRGARWVTALLPRRLYELAAPLLMGWICGPIGDGWRHPFFRWIRSSDPRQVVKRTGWEIDRDFSLDLKKLTQPTLVLLGAKDRFVPDVDDEAAALITALSNSESEVRLIPEAGHVLLTSGAVREAVQLIETFFRTAREGAVAPAEPRS
jgi:pimeloyl-ACP methyl ester carboxylesterase